MLRGDTSLGSRACAAVVRRILGPILLTAALAGCGGAGTQETASGGTSGSGALGGSPATSPSGSDTGGVPGSPNSATLSWNQNTEGDLAGYRIYYGTSSGGYVQPKGQGVVTTATQYTVTGLSSGVRYYFAVTAFDNASNESNYSQEVFKDIP